MAALRSTRITPSMIVTALATDKVMTSRTLPAVAVSERTAQRSHRGYLPASHTGRSTHYGLLSATLPPNLGTRIGSLASFKQLTWPYSGSRAAAGRRGVAGDTLCP